MTKQMHEIKTINPYFSDMWNGNKPFEIRREDRGYNLGDVLWSREYNPNDNTYTGREMLCSVDYMIAPGEFAGLSPGYCAMGCEVLQRRTV
jgi:hypothetical protein